MMPTAKPYSRPRSFLEQGMALLAPAYAGVAVYSYALFFQRLYTGFFWNSSTGEVLWLHRDAGLRLGDRLIQIGPVSVADFETAIALTNIFQADRLRALHEANIDQQEAERARLARELHDEVLADLGALGLCGDASPEFDAILTGLNTRLRVVWKEDNNQPRAWRSSSSGDSTERHPQLDPWSGRLCSFTLWVFY